MAQHFDQIIKKAHEYMHNIRSFSIGQQAIATELIKTFNENDKFNQNLHVMDYNSENIPTLLAENLLENITYTSTDIQHMLNSVSEFTKYNAETFHQYGTFLSVMIAQTLKTEKKISLNTHNKNNVHLPEHYIWPEEKYLFKEECSYPWGGIDKIKRHYKENKLISNLASKLQQGELIIIGNLGSFFATNNRGANITLCGESGWRPCYGMLSGTVTIKGTMGHEPATYSRGGEIRVYGAIRDEGNTRQAKIYHQHRLVEPEKYL